MELPADIAKLYLALLGELFLKVLKDFPELSSFIVYFYLQNLQRFKANYKTSPEGSL
jgi:hypothetical protein